MGTVYRAEHAVLPRRAAIKVMHHELCWTPGMATRMVQEAAILEDVRHPGVVRVFECNVLPDHRPWIAMELVEGETLTQRLEHTPQLPWPEVAKLIADVADVLAAVHTRGIVHRDLKPDNMLLAATDRDFPVRVIDWGVARLGPLARVTMDGLTPGTPLYMSPEQAAGKHIAAPCDIYSLGVIAYEALTGYPPYDGRTLAEVVSLQITSTPIPLSDCTDAPPELCELVQQMLDKRGPARPMAVDVRKRAHDILGPRGQQLAEIAISRTVTLDSDELENGITELLPTMRKPRWTPQFAPPRNQPITPRDIRDQVSGEILARRR
jgi:serine/threonine-protein kinase